MAGIHCVRIGIFDSPAIFSNFGENLTFVPHVFGSTVERSTTDETGNVAYALEEDRSIDAFPACADTKTIVDFRNLSVTDGYAVVSVDDVVAVDILIFDIAGAYITTKSLDRAVGDVFFRLEEAECDKTTLLEVSETSLALIAPDGSGSVIVEFLVAVVREVAASRNELVAELLVEFE